MNAKNTVSTVAAAILAVTLGMSGPALAGERHHGGHGHGYSGGHGYKHHRGHGGYGRGHGYSRHHGHRGHGHRYRPYYGYGGHSYRYYDDDYDDLLLGLILGGFTGYALNHGHRH